MKQWIQVSVTVDSREVAQNIADRVIADRLAACVHISGPIQSVYRWHGNVERAEEWLCQIKSERRLFTDLVEAVRRIHSYEVPEIVAVPLVEGDAGYLQWLAEQLRDPS